MICIWCLNDFPKLSLEHGIPEALGCPPHLELDDVACVECNNGLGGSSGAPSQATIAYQALYLKTYEREEPLAELVPAMLAAFLDSDRAFAAAWKAGGKA